MDSIKMPPVTAEFYDQLMKMYVQNTIRPETPRDKIMYEAGQQDVLEFIGRKVYRKTVSGDPQDVTTKPPALLSRLWKWLKPSR